MANKYKKTLKVVLSIIIILAAVISAYLFQAHNDPLKHNPSTPVNKTLADKLNGPSGLESWNTKQGRVYAWICGVPPSGCPSTDICMDGGLSYYDSVGKLIVNCGGMPGPYKESRQHEKMCKKMNELTTNIKPDYYLCRK